MKPSSRIKPPASHSARKNRAAPGSRFVCAADAAYEVTAGASKPPSRAAVARKPALAPQFAARTS